MGYIQKLAKRSLSTFWQMAHIMVPIMIIMRVAESYGLIDWLSPTLQPIMAMVNLPPEAAIIFVTGLFTGFYGAIAAFPILIDLDLTAAQITAICTIVLIAHGIPVEQAIVKKAGGPFWETAFLRIITALIAAILIDQLSKFTGYLSQPQSLSHLDRFAQTDASHTNWALSSIKGLLALFAILTILLVVMDLFDRIGITQLINMILSPLVRLSGLEKSVTTITTAGVVLGLSYGGGLIIAERNNPNITNEAKYYALCWLSLCHGLIEDLAVMVAIGGDIWILLVGRIILTLGIIRLLIIFNNIRGRKFN